MQPFIVIVLTEFISHNDCVCLTDPDYLSDDNHDDDYEDEDFNNSCKDNRNLDKNTNTMKTKTTMTKTKKYSFLVYFWYFFVIGFIISTSST